MMGVDMEEKSLVNYMYNFLALQKNGISDDLFINHKDIVNKLVSELNKIYKTNYDTNILFIYKGIKCFEIHANSNKLEFVCDVEKVKLDLLNELLFGGIKCSDFLIRNSSLCESKIQNYQWDFFVKEALESWNRLLERVYYREDNFFISDEAKYARVKVKENNVIWCYNKSCTGKTYLGIYALTYCNENKFVFNPSVQNSSDITLTKLLLEFGKNFAILIDDIQCDVEFAKDLLDYISKNLEELRKRNVYIFIVSWSSLIHSQEFFRYTSILPIVETNPEKFIEMMKSKLKDKEILQICDNNLALINTAIILEKNNKKIDKGDYKKELFRWFVRTEDLEQLRLVYILSVLGTYEFETPLPFIKNIGKFDLNSIVTAKVVDESIFLAHRKISNFLARYIEDRYGNGLLERKEIIKRYINYIDSSRKWKALLHLIGENKESDILSVSPIWNLMYEIQENLREQTSLDPSWNNTPSSMYFVISTACMLGVVDEYKDVIQALCSNFTITMNNQINISYDRLKTTFDFVKIRERMIEEDKQNEPLYESGEKLNLEDIHRNWLFGLLIGMKNPLISLGYSQLMSLVEIELLKSQNEQGYWYPQRVPWVTARILIGLAEAGYSIKDEHVRNGLNYLLSMIREDCWEANTGGWNNVYETSSLCLEALIKCGMDCSDSRVQRVVSFLLSHAKEWMSENSEIDGATTACSLIKIQGIQPELLNYINQLTTRNIHKIISLTNQLDYDNEQSCNTTQIAYYVVELCWYILERDIPNLLDDFILRSEKGMDESKMNKKKIFLSYSEDSPAHIKKLKKIVEFLDNEGYEVYFYGNAPLGTNNMEFMQKIKECDAILVIGTKKYKEKSSEIKAGGAFFEACVLSREFMNNNYEKIIPLAFNEFNDSFPEPLAINKGMRVKRIDQYFLKELSNELKIKLC